MTNSGYRTTDEILTYMSYIAALAWPGVKVPVFNVHTIELGDLTSWRDDDLKLVVEEGRRQVDRQLTQLDRLQNRSQFLFTTALGLSVLLIAELRNAIRHHGPIALAVAYVGLVAVLLGILGAASLMSTRAAFGGPETALMTHNPPPALLPLAEAYAGRIGVGENTVATRVTVFRDAVFLVLIGAIIYAITWAALL